MRNPEKLLKTLSELIENGILTTKDIKKEISTDFQFKKDKIINKLELVTREEFEILKNIEINQLELNTFYEFEFNNFEIRNKDKFLNKSLIDKTTIKKELKIENKINSLKRCVKCILPESYPMIKFDEEGVCNYCKIYKKQVFLGVEELIKKLGSTKNKIL